MLNWRKEFKSIRMNVFCQFFVSFFLLIMVPSIIASLFTYTYVVNLVEQEIEKSSTILIGHFAEQTDELVGSLQNEMITQMGFSELQRFQRHLQQPRHDLIRIDQIERLTNQLNVLNNNNTLVQSSYLYLVHHDAVISSNGGIFEKEVFFSYLNHYRGQNDTHFQIQFEGRKMMDFTPLVYIEQKNMYSDRVTFTHPYISTLMSFPFNTNHPEVYLVVNMDAAKLKEKITIQRSDAIETAIINKQGEVLAYSGEDEIDGQLLLASFQSDEGTMIEDGNRTLQVSFNESNSFDWIYVSMADMNELNKPVKLIQHASIVLLLFFFIIGTIISFYLSKKMYNPIREIKEDLKISRNLVTGMSPIMHEHFLNKVLYGEYLDQLSVEYYSKEIGLDISQTGNIAAICIEINYYDKLTEMLSETDKSFLMTNLKIKIEKKFKDPLWICQIRSDLLTCIVYLADNTDDERMAFADSIKEVLTSQLNFYHSTIAMGKTVHAVWELHESFRYALLLLKRKRLSPEVEICIDLAGLDNPNIFDGFLSVDKANQLLSLYKANQYEHMVEIVNYMLENSIKNHATADSVKQLSVDILNTWLRAMAADIKHDFSVEQHTAMLVRLSRCVTVDEIKLFFRQTADELFSDDQIHPQSNVFAEIMTYIKEHFGDDLSIEQFAKQLNMSVGHFSRSFKGAVGENYIDYITRCRIEASKQLLLNTDMKIDDIATEIGYLGRHFFIKTFRKYEGTTPGKYRDNHK